MSGAWHWRAETGLIPKNAEAVRQFDRKRPKKMRNEEWVNPHRSGRQDWADQGSRATDE